MSFAQHWLGVFDIKTQENNPYFPPQSDPRLPLKSATQDDTVSLWKSATYIWGSGCIGGLPILALGASLRGEVWLYALFHIVSAAAATLAVCGGCWLFTRGKIARPEAVWLGVFSGLLAGVLIASSAFSSIQASWFTCPVGAFVGLFGGSFAARAK